MEQQKILLIEPGDLIYKKMLETELPLDYEFVTIQDAKVGLRMLYQVQPALVVIDMGLPNYGAEWLCEQIRMLTDVPIILITPKSAEEDEIRGFEMGASDVVSQERSAMVIEARFQAMLRRGQWHAENDREEQLNEEVPSKPYEGYHRGGIDIDLEFSQVTRNGEPISLTATEFRILSYLVQNVDRCIGYDEMLNQIWGKQSKGAKANIHVYMSMLRRKIEPNPEQPSFLITEHGRGYRLVGEPINNASSEDFGS